MNLFFGFVFFWCCCFTHTRTHNTTHTHLPPPPQRYYLKIGDPEFAHKIFVRAFHACPWSKRLWMDGIVWLQGHLDEKQTEELMLLMQEKEIRVRAEYDEDVEDDDDDDEDLGSAAEDDDDAYEGDMHPTLSPPDTTAGIASEYIAEDEGTHFGPPPT